MGADKAGPNTIEIPEIHLDAEDYLPLFLFAQSCLEPPALDLDSCITKKTSIRWSRNNFETPETILKRENHRDSKPEPLSPLYYFQRYMTDSEFEKIAEFTMFMPTNKTTR